MNNILRTDCITKPFTQTEVVHLATVTRHSKCVKLLISLLCQGSAHRELVIDWEK